MELYRLLVLFGSLVVLDGVFRYLSLCLFYINTKIGKNKCLMYLQVLEIIL